MKTISGRRRSAACVDLTAQTPSRMQLRPLWTQIRPKAGFLRAAANADCRAGNGNRIREGMRDERDEWIVWSVEDCLLHLCSMWEFILRFRLGRVVLSFHSQRAAYASPPSAPAIRLWSTSASWTFSSRRKRSINGFATDTRASLRKSSPHAETMPSFMRATVAFKHS